MKAIKFFLLILIISLGSKTVNAQLNNTVWKGVFMVPQATECTVVFKADTMYVVFGGNINPDKIDPVNILEVSNFKISHDTMTIQKITGHSTCSEDVIGTYSFAIKDSLLLISIINDDCGTRANAFPAEPLTLLENKE